MKVWEIRIEVTYNIPNGLGTRKWSEGPQSTLYTTKEGCVKHFERFKEMTKGACINWCSVGSDTNWFGNGMNSKTYRVQIIPRKVHEEEKEEA